MLILSRKLKQKIIIGYGEDAIEVVVMGISGNQVSLGIDAPDDVDIDREEIRIKKDAESQQ
jgi:carbon storage regulator